MAITNVTLDTNSIISLDENRHQAPFIRELIELHRLGKARLRVVGISASEKQVNGSFAHSYELFKERLSKLGLETVTVLQPPAYWDITYFDASFYATTAGNLLEREIHQILWPNLPFSFHDFELGADKSKQNWIWKWRNPKCDTLAFFSHIWYGGGLFVSDDSVFHQATKKPALIRIAGGDISTAALANARIASDVPLEPVPSSVSRFLSNFDDRIDPTEVPKEFANLWENKRRYDEAMAAKV